MYRTFITHHLLCCIRSTCGAQSALGWSKMMQCFCQTILHCMMLMSLPPVETKQLSSSKKLTLVT